MYSINDTDYGFRITASGEFASHEVEQIQMELFDRIEKRGTPFSLVVDIRRHIPLNESVLREMESLHRETAKKGLVRAAIIIDSPIIKGQAVQIGHSSHTISKDRFIDAAKYCDWEERAIAWARDGVEVCSESPIKKSIST